MDVDGNNGGDNGGAKSHAKLDRKKKAAPVHVTNIPDDVTAASMFRSLIDM